MNLFLNLFISALVYHSSFYSTVVGRISDKRKCADADCSEPVSLATTLIRYNSDDERLLSFPRNVKLKVFSKEAGDMPNFWEVEIYGKRGYVPKTFLREDKVLIASNKLTHIVPTGRIDRPKQNSTDENLKDKESSSVNLLSATPKLPVANSKGLFSTIGGVSADSVPMNSPDIKPQSTRKYEVFQGTTLYDDVVSEKPESPPIVIDDPANEKQDSGNKPPSDSKEVPHDSNVPSPDIKPVNEEINESQQVVGTEQKNGKEVDGLVAKEEELKKEKSEDKRNKPEEGSPEYPEETNILGNFVNSVSNFIYSGAGEGITEEELEEEGDEDDEGSAEEEDYEEEEEKSDTERTTRTEPGQESQREERPLEASHTSEAPSLITIRGESSSDLKPDNALKSEKYDILNQGSVQNEVLPGKTIDAESNGRSAEEPGESSSGNKKDVEENIKDDKHQSKDEENKEAVFKPTGVENVESGFTQRPDLLRQENIKSQEEESLTSGTDSAYEQPMQQGTTKVIQHLTEVLKPAKDKSLEKETTSEQTENQSNEASESEVKPDSTEPQVKEPQPAESLVEEQPKIDDAQVQEQFKSDEVQIQELPKTDKQQVQEEPKTKEQTKSDDHRVQDQPETTTGSPLVEQTDRQFMFGARQSVEVSSEPDVYETSETPPPIELDIEIRPQADHNQTAQVDNLPPSDPTYSSLPTFQSIGSPKYSSVVSRRIQSSEPTVNEILSHSEEDEESEPQPDHINDTSENTPIHGETLSSNLFPHSQSPTYNSVISQRIGSFAATEDVKSETTPEAVPKVETEHPESADVSAAEDKSADLPTVEFVSQLEVKPEEEIKSKEEPEIQSTDVTLEDSQLPTPSIDVVHEAPEETTLQEGMFSWVTSLFDVFGSKATSSTEESPAISEDLDPLLMTHHTEESCSAGGVEGSCPMSREPTQKEVTWQESSYTSDMWDLMEKVPLEATIWLVITAVVVLIFSLGHYYIEAHRRDGPLVAVINKLEREVLILKKESCILEDSLQVAQQQLEAWNTSSTENDALIVELKQELEETKAAKAELEEQATQLKEELETVTESGLEMHRLLEESLSSQDGSQVLLSTVETLREKLQRQEEEISGLSDTLSSKNAEVEEMQGKLVQAAEVARSLEDRVISVTREKEEELLQLRDKHRELISQLEEVMETKALDETRLSTEMSKLRLTIEELQKSLAEKDSELDTLKEVVKQLRSTDSNERMEALFDVVGVQAKLKTAVAERDDFREKFFEEEGARKLLEGHMMKITQEVADLKNSFETAEKEKIEALTKLQVLSNYFKEKESQLQKELGLQESMWLQKQSDDHTIYEQMRSLREENEKYKLQNESLKKEIVEQEASFKIQLANTEQKAHENWVASRQAERKVKEVQQEAAQLRNRLTTVEKNTGNYSLDEKPNISESNGDPSSPPPSLMFPPTTSPPFMMYGPPIPPPGDFVPPPPFMSSPYPSDSRPPPLGRISSPPLDHRFSPPPPLPYSPYDYSPYGHHSPSPPPPLAPHHRTVHKPQPREMSREQKDHVPNYSPDTEKTSRRNKR